MNCRNEKLWARYCHLRDSIVMLHLFRAVNGLPESPETMRFLFHPEEQFYTFTPPEQLQPPRKQYEWLRRAIRRCQALLRPTVSRKIRKL